MKVDILCLRSEDCLHILYYCFLGWAGTTEKILFPMLKDTVWCEVNKEHPGSLYQRRSIKDPFPSNSHCTPIVRGPCSEGESHVRGTST
jgi:hypothetical protein